MLIVLTRRGMRVVRVIRVAPTRRIESELRTRRDVPPAGDVLLVSDVLIMWTRRRVGPVGARPHVRVVRPAMILLVVPVVLGITIRAGVT